MHGISSSLCIVHFKDGIQMKCYWSVKPFFFLNQLSSLCRTLKFTHCQPRCMYFKKYIKIFFFYTLSSLSEAVYQMSVVWVCNNCDFLKAWCMVLWETKATQHQKSPLPSAELHNDLPSDFSSSLLKWSQGFGLGLTTLTSVCHCC